MSSVKLVVVCLVLAACGNHRGNSLVRVEQEPEGVNCAAGGLAIHTGIDSNGDAVLGDTEIVDTEYLCIETTEIGRASCRERVLCVV